MQGLSHRADWGKRGGAEDSVTQPRSIQPSPRQPPPSTHPLFVRPTARPQSPPVHHRRKEEFQPRSRTSHPSPNTLTHPSLGYGRGMSISGTDPSMTQHCPPKPREEWLPWTQSSKASKGLTDCGYHSLQTSCVWGGGGRGVLLWPHFRDGTIQVREGQ